jgi:hypothetical protein
MKGSACVGYRKVVLRDIGVGAARGTPTSRNDVEKDVFMWSAGAPSRAWGDADA